MHCCTDTSPMSVFIMKMIMMMIIVILAQGGGCSQECSLAWVLSIAPFGTRPLCERVKCHYLPTVFSSISNERSVRLRYMAVFAWFLHNCSLAESDAWRSGQWTSWQCSQCKTEQWTGRKKRRVYGTRTTYAQALEYPANATTKESSSVNEPLLLVTECLQASRLDKDDW